MDNQDQNSVIGFIEWVVSYLVAAPQPGSLYHASWMAALRRVRDVGMKYKELQCINRTNSRTMGQYVVVSDFTTYILSQRPVGQIYTDFPYYRNRDPAIVDATSDTYYRIDKVIHRDAHYQPDDGATAAIVGPCQHAWGRGFQRIRFLSSSGAELLTGLRRVDFSWPIDP